MLGSIDTSGESHTGKYLADIAEREIKEVEEVYEVKVVDFIIDNAENVKK